MLTNRRRMRHPAVRPAPTTRLEDDLEDRGDGEDDRAQRAGHREPFPAFVDLDFHVHASTALGALPLQRDREPDDLFPVGDGDVIELETNLVKRLVLEGRRREGDG